MFDRLPGFRDFYPEECAVRNHLFRNWRSSARRFGFAEYDAPALESLDLFRAKSGDEIVEQLFSFTDRGGREVALRPEMTPSLARLAGARAHSLRKPVKWFSIGEQYRYERQQRGRLRSFYQFNADILGEPGPEAEIELIALLIHLFTAFGLTEDDIVVRLSDRDLWFFYLQGMGLDDDGCGGVLSVIDKMGRESEEKTLEKLKPYFGARASHFLAKISMLREVSSLEEMEEFLLAHSMEGEARVAVEKRVAEWRTLVSGLNAMGLGGFIEVNLSIVRGLAYYTGFVFEAFDRDGKFRALAGGGRYDHLIEKLSGPQMAAAGLGVGDATLWELLTARKLLPRYVDAADIFVVTGGEAEREAAFRDIGRLREAGFRVEYSLKPVAFGKQFKLAASSGARLALIYGSEELANETVKARNLADRTEQEVPAARVIDFVREAF